MGTENKPRYIDADYLEQFAMPIKDHTGKVDKVVLYKYIADAPNADVQPVKYGRWVKNKENGYYECSICKATKPYDGIDEGDPEKVAYWVSLFCPHCGAKMDGVKQ